MKRAGELVDFGIELGVALVWETQRTERIGRQAEPGPHAGGEHCHVPRLMRRSPAPQLGYQTRAHNGRLAATGGTDHRDEFLALLREAIKQIVNELLAAEEKR